MQVDFKNVHVRVHVGGDVSEGEVESDDRCEGPNCFCACVRACSCVLACVRA